MKKLVRDKIPEIIAQETGQTVNLRVLDDEEFIRALKVKLIEEATEVNNAESKEEIIEELADLLEVYYKLCDEEHITYMDILTAMSRKYADKGSFENRYFISEC